MKKTLWIKKQVKKNYSISEHTKIFIIGQSGGEVDIHLVLDNPDVSCEVHGIIVGCNEDHFSINITGCHWAPRTKSMVNLRVVLFDKARLDFTGMLKIGPKAQLASAYLENYNLLVGDGVVCNCIPQLEIEADNVKASHGVTISTFDDVQKHYLQTRGLGKDHCERVLVEGFIRDSIKNFNSDVKVNHLLQSKYAK